MLAAAYPACAFGTVATELPTVVLQHWPLAAGSSLPYLMATDDTALHCSPLLSTPPTTCNSTSFLAVFHPPDPPSGTFSVIGTKSNSLSFQLSWAGLLSHVVMVSFFSSSLQEKIIDFSHHLGRYLTLHSWHPPLYRLKAHVVSWDSRPIPPQTFQAMIEKQQSLVPISATSAATAVYSIFPRC